MIMFEIRCRMEVAVVINFTGFFSRLQTWLPGNVNNRTVLSKASLLSLGFLPIRHSKQTKAKPGLHYYHCKVLSSQHSTAIAVLKPEQLK